MAVPYFWEGASRGSFLTVVIVLLGPLLGVTALAAFTGTLWTVGVALLFAPFAPLFYYIDARARHKIAAKSPVVVIYLFMTAFGQRYLLLQLTPYSLVFLAVLEEIGAIVLVAILGILLCERYLKPRLKPRLLPTRS